MNAKRKQDRDGLYRQPGSRFWYCTFTTPDGVRHRESTKRERRDDAQDFLDERRGQRRTGRLNITAKEVTFEDLVALLEADYRAKENRSKPYISGAVRDRFAGWKALAITAAALRQFEADRLKVAKRATINRELAAIRRAFNLATEDGGPLSGCAVPKIRTPDPKNARKGFLDEKALAAVLAELPEWARGPVRFMSYTGWRVRSEVLRLTWKVNLDWRAKVVRLEPGSTKNAEGREFPFGEYPALKALLEAQLASGEEHSSPYVFFYVIDGTARPIGYKQLRLAWRGACRRARHPGLFMHDLRRTVVRHFERAGVSRSVAMSLTGHKTAAVYARYAIVESAAQAEGVAKLAKLDAVPA